MNNASRPQAACFKQNNNKKTSQTKHSPRAALEKAVGLHASPGFPSCKTKPPVKEETAKTPEPGSALSKKAFLTVDLLSEWLEAADCQPGLGQGSAGMALLSAGGLGVSEGACWGTGLWAPCLQGEGEGGCSACQAEVPGAWVVLQQRGTSNLPRACASSQESREGEGAPEAAGAHTPAGGGEFESSCRWRLWYRKVSQADRSPGSSVPLGLWLWAAEPRPGPAVLGAANSPLVCRALPGSPEAACCPLPQAATSPLDPPCPPSPPRGCSGMGAVSRSALCSRPSCASPELSVAACPAPPVLPPHGCVWLGRHAGVPAPAHSAGLQEAPEPSTRARAPCGCTKPPAPPCPLPLSGQQSQ